MNESQEAVVSELRARVAELEERLRAQEEADEAMSRERRRMETILSGVADGITAQDLSGHLVYANEAAARILGFPDPETLLATPPVEIMEHFKVYDEWNRPYPLAQMPGRAVLAGQAAPDVTLRYRVLSTGEDRWSVTKARPVYDENGNVELAVNIFQDVTGLKQGERAQWLLARAADLLSGSTDEEEQLGLLAQLVVERLADWCAIDLVEPDGSLRQVVVAHRDPERVAWARAFREHNPPDMDAPTGVPHVIRTGETEEYPEITEEMIMASNPSPEQLEVIRSLGLHSSIIVPLIARDRTLGALTLVWSESEHRFNRSEAELARALAGRAALFFDNARLFRESQLLNAELEARVERRTEQLEASNVRLEASNRELQDFAYVASHDLQEPLRKILAFGGRLGSRYADLLDEDGAMYLGRMLNAAQRMQRLIDDLLALSRISTDVHPFGRVDLSEVARGVISDLESRIDEADARIEVGELPIVEADPVQMRQLLQNLLSNAIKYRHPDRTPVVWVAAESAGRMPSGAAIHRITVRDNGIGFEEQYAERIFLPFERLHGHLAYEGTGMGLAVCRKIVQRHSGTISAAAVPDVGSVFTVLLPDRQRPGP